MPATATTCLPPLQELCESRLDDFTRVMRGLYDEAGAPQLDLMAPILTDVANGMAYLHSRNIVHGGRL